MIFPQYVAKFIQEGQFVPGNGDPLSGKSATLTLMTGNCFLGRLGGRHRTTMSANNAVLGRHHSTLHLLGGLVCFSSLYAKYSVSDRDRYQSHPPSSPFFLVGGFTYSGTDNLVGVSPP